MNSRCFIKHNRVCVSGRSSAMGASATNSDGFAEVQFVIASSPHDAKATGSAKSTKYQLIFGSPDFTSINTSSLAIQTLQPPFLSPNILMTAILFHFFFPEGVQRLMPRVYTEVFERLSLKPCVASVKEDFFFFFFFHGNCNHWSRAAVQLPRPKQTRGCAPLPPITKALTAHIPDPDLSSSPTFLIKNHSWFGSLSFFPLPLSPPSCLAASCSVALQPFAAFILLLRCNRSCHALSATLHPNLRRDSLSIVYTLLGSLHTLSAAIIAASGRGCRPLSAPSRWADLRVLPPPAASFTLMWKQSLSDFVS